ncbi:MULTISPECIES: putative metal-binding motif-containing protein [unclassified Corallococcus]|uniref:putative metal-binding motif-containing protein n=1 Tax=unclassified Corallococcus TaxID=2685029 RepID=UPI001A8FEA03|nr:MULTISPECIES: putative metal-binding motif-containing protein [unclassified Corallococcus]MBN9687226.1 putative metal-binding motif-containing protein [Corallococcus sp. NCSPR001]WAS88946.1 putative metal-binding motif-containing protein [Corallococcus sp. NCRR]
MQSLMKGWGSVSLVAALWLVGCGSSTSPSAPGGDAGTTVDAGADAGVTDDAGTPDSGVVPEGPPCEKTLGVCAGAKHAWVDGAFEPVCTARSYGADYEATETRCDGLDNDCDGVTDPTTWADAAPMQWAPDEKWADSLPVAGGFLFVSSDGLAAIELLRLDAALALQGRAALPMSPAPIRVSRAQLLRTARGPALFSIVVYSEPSYFVRGSLLQLDERGTPMGESAVLFEGPYTWANGHVAPSLDGERLAVTWTWELAGAREVQGMTVDPTGQVLAAPRVLYRSDSLDLSAAEVLGLGDGGFLVKANENKAGTFDDTRVWLQRYDRELLPVGDERILTVKYAAAPRLMLTAPLEEGGAGEPTLLYRDPHGFTPQFLQVRSLFDQGMAESLTATKQSQTAEFGATMTSRGLQLAWVSMLFVSNPSGDASFSVEGRLWGRSASGIVTDWTPGTPSIPMHVASSWVRLHELAGHQLGALTMTATDQPRTYTLRSLRYCAP